MQGVTESGRLRLPDEGSTHLKDVAFAADDEPGRWLLVPVLGTTHVALAPRGHWRRIRNGACASSRVHELDTVVRAGPDEPTPPPLGCVSIRVSPKSFCHFHVVGSRTAWCLTYFSDETSAYFDRHLRISDRTGARVRSCSRVVAVT